MTEAIDLSPRVPCQRDPELWFSDSPAHLEEAKRLCAACPLRQACLAGALARAEPWGVWGGEIFKDGGVVPFKRRPGRPPKGRGPTTKLAA
jgi:WhiB family redox-sensing transcriptional regulator